MLNNRRSCGVSLEHIGITPINFLNEIYYEIRILEEDYCRLVDSREKLITTLRERERLIDLRYNTSTCGLHLFIKSLAQKRELRYNRLKRDSLNELFQLENERYQHEQQFMCAYRRLIRMHQELCDKIKLV